MIHILQFKNISFQKIMHFDILNFYNRSIPCSSYSLFTIRYHPYYQYLSITRLYHSISLDSFQLDIDFFSLWFKMISGLYKIIYLKNMQALRICHVFHGKVTVLHQQLVSTWQSILSCLILFKQILIFYIARRYFFFQKWRNETTKHRRSDRTKIYFVTKYLFRYHLVR